MSKNTLDRLLTLGTLQQFAAGAQLLTQGDRSRHLYVLLDGWAKVTADSAEGHPTLLALRGRGDAVGELASLDGAVRSATVTAVGTVRARRVGHLEVQHFLGEHPDAALALGSYVSRKLRWATERRVDFDAFPVAIRLARVLVSLAEAYGYATEDGIALGIEISQPEIAGLIGASEPSVHRALRDLKQAGILAVGYRHFVIQHPTRLAAVAQLTSADIHGVPTAPAATPPT